MTDWLQGWGAWDDEALAALTSKGLVRRAAKAVADARLHNVQGDSAVVETGGFAVTIGPRGPAAASCPCPAAGVCVHILTAAMLARSAAPDDAAATDPLEDLLSIEPAAWCREAGAAAVRTALASSPEPEGADLTQVDGRLRIAWPGADPVTYAPGQGLAGMSSPAPRSRWSALHLEAVARAFVASGQQWNWPQRFLEEAQSRAEEDRPVALLGRVRSWLGSIVEDGLADLGPSSLASLTELRTELRAARLPRLAGMLGTTVGHLEAVSRRDDGTDDATVLESIARAWALSVAVEDSFPDALTGRSADTSGGELELCVLGATWWESGSGSRGVDVALWDPASSRSLTTTVGRAAGQDPTFTRSLDTIPLWGLPVRALLGHLVRIPQARLRPEGSVAPTAVERAVPQRRITLDELATIGAHTAFAAPTADPFGGGRGGPILLRPDGRGTLTIDEPRQAVLWSVPSGEATLTLRAPALRENRGRLERIQDLVEFGRPIEAIVAVPRVHRNVMGWDPVAVFVNDRRGTLRGVSLDFEGAVAATRRNRWLSRGLDRLAAAGAAPSPTSAVDRLVRDVLELAADLAVRGVGRSAPGERCTRLAARADDLALATLAGSLRALAEEPGGESLVRVVLVTLMVRELAWLAS